MARTPTPKIDNDVRTLLYAVTGTTGTYQAINFRGKSIVYFDIPIDQTYDHVLIDNIGTGDIRIALRPGLVLTDPIIGAKTLKAGDSLYVSERIEHITIYFIQTSTVELILLEDSLIELK